MIVPLMTPVQAYSMYMYLRSGNSSIVYDIPPPIEGGAEMRAKNRPLLRACGRGFKSFSDGRVGGLGGTVWGPPVLENF